MTLYNASILRQVGLYALVVVLAIATPTWGKTGPCEPLYNACKEVIASQDKEIVDLKSNIKQLEGALASSQSSYKLPTYVPFVVGLLLGAFVVDRLKR